MARARRTPRTGGSSRRTGTTRRSTRRGRGAPAPAPGTAPGGRTARVRMYRQGLGDCFLVTLPGAAGPFHVLIDCGVFRSTAGEKDRMVKVAQDVLTATDRHLNLLIATHEHYDHIIGFKHAAAVFKDMTIDQVWLAWTEDGADPIASQLREMEARLKTALYVALTRMQGSPALAARAKRLAAVLSFGGDPLDARYSTQLGETMRAIEAWGQRPVRYVRPGPPAIVLEGAEGIRGYVLGPPRDVEAIKAMNDPGGETYEQRLALARAQGFAMGLGLEAGARDAGEAAALGQPFEPHYRLDERAARRERTYREHYGFGAEGPDPWRRIDLDWLGAAEDLAIQLDSYTNNSSLAVALELGDEGPVLLFAADAQVGNWLSWHDHVWELPRGGGGTRRVTATDLMARTALYKVGHHGSHNATLMGRGLELMTSPDLVAMIPTDEAWARDRYGWEMPYGPLAERLLQRTRGRVLRVDHGLPAADTIEASARASFQQRARETKLYVEYEVGG